MDDDLTLQYAINSQLAYRDEGCGNPILLIHGWGVSGASFNHQIKTLSSRYRLIAPDLKGHGASPNLCPQAPFSSLADDIAALIAELKLENLVVVGWSMGAMISWDLLARYTDLDIAGLVTVEMTPRLLNEPDWKHGLRDGSGIEVFDQHIKAMRTDWPVFTARFIPLIFAPAHNKLTQERINQTTKVALKNDPESLSWIWLRMAEQDFRQNLTRIHLPALVIAGGQSQLYQLAACKWVAQQLPDAKLEVFTHSGHAPHMEEPEHFNRLLSEFVDSVVPFPAPKAQFPAHTCKDSKQ